MGGMGGTGGTGGGGQCTVERAVVELLRGPEERVLGAHDYQVSLVTERVLAGEILLQPSIIGIDQMGLGEILCQLQNRFQGSYSHARHAPSPLGSPHGGLAAVKHRLDPLAHIFVCGGGIGRPSQSSLQVRTRGWGGGGGYEA